MDIKRGKYTLKSDRWCFWVEEEYEFYDKKTDKTKVLTRNASGYYADIEQLANGLVDHLIGESDATSMRKLLEDIRGVKQKVAKMTYNKLSQITEEQISE